MQKKNTECPKKFPRDYINMLVLDIDMARYNSTHPMKVHECLKVMGIGCPNKWDMRIL